MREIIITIIFEMAESMAVEVMLHRTINRSLLGCFIPASVQ
jgi:hypothetical protein